MENTESTADAIETLFEKAEAYAKTNIDLIKLKSIDKSSEVISKSASKLVFIFLGLIIFFLLSIGLSVWIGEMTGEMYYGFFIVAAIYVLLSVVLYFFRDTLIKKPINDSIIIQLLEKY